MDYKGIDLGIFLQGVGKRDYWGSGSIVIPGFNYLEAWYTHQLDYWTPENTDAFYPRLTNNGQSNNARNFLRQTRYLLDMSYCRVKNVTLGYTFPENWMRKIHLQKLRVYLSLENLFEFDHMGDVPIDDKIYQNTRRFVWSEDNPCFFRGKDGEGVGGPHIGYDMVWPMSIMMKCFTATDDEEIKWCMRTLVNTDAGMGFMHESFDKDNAKNFTRPWFAWQNTLFGELVLKLLADGKIDLLNNL